MREGDLCHYLNTQEDHSVDVKPCRNCGVPVCASEDCRVDGLCFECNIIKDDKQALLFRAMEMEEFYKRAYKVEDYNKSRGHDSEDSDDI